MPSSRLWRMSMGQSRRSRSRPSQPMLHGFGTIVQPPRPEPNVDRFPRQMWTDSSVLIATDPAQMWTESERCDRPQRIDSLEKRNQKTGTSGRGTLAGSAASSVRYGKKSKKMPHMPHDELGEMSAVSKFVTMACCCSQSITALSLRSNYYTGHNCTGQNYIGHHYIVNPSRHALRSHNYTGDNCVGHHYIGHHYIGHHYIVNPSRPSLRSHDYTGHNCVGHHVLGYHCIVNPSRPFPSGAITI